MPSISEIKQPISKELIEFEKKFKISLRSEMLLLNKITAYILKRKGKQIRPMFVFLVAKLCGGITESTYRGATLVELMHTASLIHDDVVDNAYQRRGFFSINALWKNKISVLVGDFLLAKGLLLSVEYKDYNLLEIVSEAVKQMSEGELLQIEKARNVDTSEEIYFEVIRKKTASLIASCCACGASSAGADAEKTELMRLFGEKIGIAFQIKDDTFDFGTDEVGKPLGLDIKEKKITLPLIYALNQVSKAEKNKIINLVKNSAKDTNKIKEITTFVNQNKGLAYANEKMNLYLDEALAILQQFEDSETKTALKKLITYTIDRKK
ncbi:MAG: polyprenyl synthetase family protein [Sphingobacteriaceae bacterium]|nr:polyprenyl synthetase family protein [Sphingobacteriaceae bacterium]